MSEYNLTPNTDKLTEINSQQKTVECIECGREVKIDKCRDPDEYKCGYCR